MSDKYLGQISIMSFNYAPKDWSQCDGQSLAIASMQALYAIIGNAFGGDGRTTFNLPELRGRTVVGTGTLGNYIYTRGQFSGFEDITLTANEMPQHTHILHGQNDYANSGVRAENGDMFANEAPAGGEVPAYAAPSSSLTEMYSQIVGTTGGGQSHTNMQPYAAVNYVIAIDGLFPPRN